MGGGISVSDLPDFLDASDCQSLMGDQYDGYLFESVSSGGTVSRQAFLDAMNERTDCFLTHDWGKELGVDNHARVSVINTALKARGLRTWFDEEQVLYMEVQMNAGSQIMDTQMRGNVKEEMVKGINFSQCVVVFITRRYIDKVKGSNAEDNCQVTRCRSRLP